MPQMDVLLEGIVGAAVAATAGYLAWADQMDDPVPVAEVGLVMAHSVRSIRVADDKDKCVVGPSLLRRDVH